MTVKITIDGRTIEAKDGEDLLAVCLANGIDIPYFCWHGALGSAGACRQCAVRVYGGPDDDVGKIVMSCMTPVSDGLRVSVADQEASNFRARVIEWLMINHPHDCPVCEEAGSCHLQDMTIATGHHSRRYQFDKRTHRNQDLGPLLTHEMNRCIACYRCTRFYRDYAGGRDLDAFGSHGNVYFGRAEDGVLESPFAGNLAEVCPTGVFNDKGWSQHYARKWDMKATPSICPHCAVGCNLFVAERGGQVRRVQNRYHSALNGYFLCDRGRFGPLHVVSERRLTAPRRGNAALSDHDAINAAQQLIAAGAIGIGSPRASLEANAALRRLVGPERFFAGVSDVEARLTRRMAELLRARPSQIASLSEIERCDAVLVLGEQLTDSAPRMALALRQASRGAERELAAQKGVHQWLDQAVRVAGEGRRSPIMLATPLPDSTLDPIATLALRRDPLQIAALGHAVAAALAGRDEDRDASDIARALQAAKRPLIIAGSGLGLADTVEAAAAIAAALGGDARIALIAPEANSFGLALLSGEGIEAATAALRRGPARHVIVLENDLFERAPRACVEQLLGAADEVIALDCLDNETTQRAHLVLPVASFSEQAGSYVNYEGRAQRFFAAVPPSADVPASWRRLAALGAGPFTALDQLIDAILAERPDLAGLKGAAPEASCQCAHGHGTRTPRPLSGRTADDRAGRDPAATPPPDPDSALGFGMEGSRGRELPPALLTGYDTHGLHSANAVTRFVEEINGPLRGGDPGARLFGAKAGTFSEAAPPAVIAGEGLLLLPLPEVFSGTETSRASALLAARAPAPRLLLHPDDAARLGLKAGDAVLINGEPCAAPLTLEPSLARGMVALSAGTLAPRGPLRRVRVEAAR